MKHETITDAELLDIIEAGTLEIRNIDDEHPELWFRGRKLKEQLNRQGGRRYTVGGSKRYRWEIRYEGKRRRIMRSRLVILFKERRLITEDERIHHGEKGRLHDGAGNLQRLTCDEHDRIHYAEQEPF